MKSVDAFLEDVVNKPVFYYIYAYYDEKLETFHQPFFTKDEPEFMLEQLKGSLLKGQIDVKNMVDLNLVLMGKFDLKTGQFEYKDVSEYQIICECNRYIQKPVSGGQA